MNTEALIAEVLNRNNTQMRVAEHYAAALRNYFDMDWKAVNEAILTRWKMSGLVRIKEWAWAINERRMLELATTTTT